MKLDKMVIAHASALSSAILWILCALGVALFPSFVESIRELIMHGAAATGPLEVTMTSFLLGGLAVIVISWIWGYVFGWAWEYCSKHCS